MNVCIKQNSILYLPTGSGKTLLALAVINHFSDELKRPVKAGGRRSLFLVNTVCLGSQITEEVRKNLGFEVACWTSESNKKSWSKEKFRAEFDKHQVIVATAQLFLDAVKHSFISIDQINVIIFDECHHGRMNHPYHELMKQFQYIDVKKHPKIIGLSGMLIGISSKMKEDDVEKELQALESTFLSTIVTVNRMQEYKNVLLYSTNPKEGFLKFTVTPSNDLTSRIIKRVGEIRWELSKIKIESLMTINPQTLRKSTPKKLKELSLLFEDFKYELDEMGIYGGYLSIQAIRIQFELAKQQQNKHKKIAEVIEMCLKFTRELSRMIENEIDVKNLSTDEIMLNSSFKVRVLVAILKQKFTEKSQVKDLQCLIFMKRRFTAKCLYHLLKRYSELDQQFPIKPDFVVGVNSELPESISEILSSSYNKFAIERFRVKETNCICTSSVLEEGMDLQLCNLVVMYDFPTTFRSYQQSKGRARSRESDYIVLLPADSAEKFLSKRNQYDAIEQNMRKILIEKTCDRELSIAGIEKERLEQWQPLITEDNALMNNISAVSLLNRYVSRFSSGNAIWEREDFRSGKVAAIVKLPPQTGIHQPIKSDVFGDIKVAKQNAAFKACEKLHELGKLDENLMPNYSHD